MRNGLEQMLEAAMSDDLILDATLSTSNASAAAIWRIRDSSVELGRSFPFAARMGFDVSLSIDRMEEYADTLDARVKAIDPQAFTIVMGHVGDGNLHPSVYHEHTPDKHDEFEKLVYDLTGEFGGSISAEHGIGITRRPYLKMSRTEEEIETMSSPFWPRKSSLNSADAASWLCRDSSELGCSLVAVLAAASASA